MAMFGESGCWRLELASTMFWNGRMFIMSNYREECPVLLKVMMSCTGKSVLSAVFMAGRLRLMTSLSRGTGNRQDWFDFRYSQISMTDRVGNINYLSLEKSRHFGKVITKVSWFLQEQIIVRIGNICDMKQFDNLCLVKITYWNLRSP